MSVNFELNSVNNTEGEELLSSHISDIADETARDVLKSLASAETTIFWRIKAILWRVWVRQTPDEIVEALSKWRNDLLNTIENPTVKTKKYVGLVVPKATNDDNLPEEIKIRA